MTVELFELNDLSNMKVIQFNDGDQVSNIYWMDDFYKDPDGVFDYIQSEEPPLWKFGDEWPDAKETSLNTKYFEDRRHMRKTPHLKKVYNQLSKFTRQDAMDYDLVTNYTRFSRVKENPYETHYWWPHHDGGYNGICYLSKNEEIGTNIYKPLITDRPDILPLDENDCHRDEHGIPWTPKELWDIVIRFRSKYNRFVMFEGSMYYHSMDLTGKNYFGDHYSDADYRINQVFFFSNDSSEFSKGM